MTTQTLQSVTIDEYPNATVVLLEDDFFEVLDDDGYLIDNCARVNSLISDFVFFELD